jgi:hypothetical protein
VNTVVVGALPWKINPLHPTTVLDGNGNRILDTAVGTTTYSDLDKSHKISAERVVEAVNAYLPLRKAVIKLWGMIEHGVKPDDKNRDKMLDEIRQLVFDDEILKTARAHLEQMGFNNSFVSDFLTKFGDDIVLFVASHNGLAQWNREAVEKAVVRVIGARLGLPSDPPERT